MTQIKTKDLKRIRSSNKNRKIVFCSGSFDLLHAGHVLFLEDCKKLGDLVVVALGSDKAIKKYKNKLPVLNDHIRIKVLDSLKPVDYTFLDTATNILTLLKKVFPKLQPDYYVINTDAKFIGERKKIADLFNVKMAIFKRDCPPEFKKISTTKIIEKIKSS